MRTRLITAVIIILLMLINVIGLQLCFQEDLVIHYSTANSKWIEETEDDFKQGTLSNLFINSTGEIELSKDLRSINDEFYFDDNKISYIENLSLTAWYGNVNSFVVLDNIYGGKNDDFGSSTIATPDEGYLILGSTYSYGTGTDTGNSNPNVWLLKLDMNLNEEWNRTFGGKNFDRGYSILLTSDNELIILAETNSFGNNESSIWIIKTDIEGNELWNKTLGPTSNYYDYTIRETSDGGYIILNSKLIKVDKNFNEQWNRSIAGKDVQQTSDGGYIIINKNLVKTNETGDVVWIKEFDSMAYGSAVVQTYDGGYLMSIHHYPLCGNGHVVAEVLKTDSYGQEQWYEFVGYSGDSYIDSIIASNDGDYIFAGSVEYYYSWYDAFLMKIDIIGETKWERLYGEMYSRDFLNSVIQDKDEGYVLIGGIDNYQNDRDVLLIKTDVNGYTNSKGKLVSKDLLESIDKTTFSSFETFIANASIPGNSSIGIQFSEDNETWFDSNGILNNYDNLSDGLNAIDLGGLKWKIGKFYYRCDFYFDDNFGPVFHNISLVYYEREVDGSFLSQIFEGIGNANWKTLKWDAHVPLGTKIKFQLRTGTNDTDISSKRFIGPDGSISSFYNDSPSNIWPSHKGYKCIQYKAFFEGNVIETPILNKITIDYNLIPLAPTINNSIENKWINFNDLIINWQFKDRDGEQSGFQILIDDSSDFDDIDLEIINESSPNQFWRWNSNSMNLGDGIWFFKIRTKDDGGEWSKYSNYSKLNIDTEPPLDFVLGIDERVWYSIDQQEIHFGTNDITSGIDHYEVKVDDGFFTNQESPYIIPELDDGIHYVYVRAYDKAGNYKEISSRVQIDTTPPAIIHKPVQSTEEGETIIIWANITDELSGVLYVFLYYRNIGEKSYFSVMMDRNGNEYTAIIPPVITTSNMKYFIYAKDRSNPPNIIYYGKYGGSDLENLLSNTIWVLKNKSNENINDDMELDEKIDQNNIDHPQNDAGNNLIKDHDKDPKQNNSSLILFFIILGIIISIIWVRILGKYDLISPYLPSSPSPSAHPYIFSSGVQPGLGHIGEYIPPDNNEKLSEKDLDRLEYFKPRPQPPEMGSRQLFKSQRAMMKIKCYTCGKPQMTRISRIPGHNICSECKNILK